MTALCILMATSIDAFADGLRAKLYRPWTIVLGVLGDGLILWRLSEWPTFLTAFVVAGMLVCRLMQEEWWHHPMHHTEGRFDDWHIVKGIRLYAPIIVLMVLEYGIGWEWLWLPAAGAVVWGLSIRTARWKWSNPWS